MGNPLQNQPDAPPAPPDDLLQGLREAVHMALELCPAAARGALERHLAMSTDVHRFPFKNHQISSKIQLKRSFKSMKTALKSHGIWLTHA